MTLNDAIDRLWDKTLPAFRQRRTWEKGRTLLYGALTCLRRHTVTGLLCASNQQFGDWSAAYRIFGRKRMDPELVWSPIRKAVFDQLSSDAPIVASLDDTLVRKRGRKVSGTSWKRDPMGPHFCANFVWAQRFLQISLLLADGTRRGSARAVPVDFTHAPTAPKPRKGAPPQAWEQYRQLQSQRRIAAVAAQRLAHLREQLNQEEAMRGRQLVLAVDGGYTNKTLCRQVPEGTTLIGRIRKDAKLFSAPCTPAKSTGRPRFYGERLLTPEELREDERVVWTTVKAYAAGCVHDFEVKTLESVRWSGTGNIDVRLLVIRPLAYRPRKGARLLYRDPAYLICTDPQLPLETLLQAYLWRWQIEVNFRDEKTLMGMGEAQMRTEQSVAQAPMFIAASYAILQLGAAQAGVTEHGLPMPKWRQHQPPTRCSTGALINQLRAEMWGKALGLPLHGFGYLNRRTRTGLNPFNQVASAVCYALK